MRLGRHPIHKMKQALRSLLGDRSYFLISYLISGFYNLARSGFRLGYKRSKELEKYLNIDEIVFKNNMYLIAAPHILGVKPIRSITSSFCCGDEGGGFQTLMRMRAMAFARSLGLQYVHTPVFQTDHADRPMKEFASDWERFFNLGENEIVSDQVNLGLFDFLWGPNSIILNLFNRKDSHSALEPMIPEFIRKFYNVNEKTKRGTEEVSICVHIRRGDVDQARDDMWTENSKIIRTMERVKASVMKHGVPYKFHIISEGDTRDFSDFEQKFDISLCLNEDPLLSLRKLIDADLLIMGKSCFSYVAALISDGIKIYEPCYFAPMSDWIVLDHSAGFDTSALERRLIGRFARDDSGPLVAD